MNGKGSNFFYAGIGDRQDWKKMLSIYSYILFTVALQFAVYNFQFFTDVLSGAPQIALMFAAGFISSLFGSVWKKLRIAPLYLGPVILLVLELSELSYFYIFGGPELLSSELKSSEFIDLLDTTQILFSVGMQLFVCLVVTVGIRINEKFEKFSIRRGATDLDEVTKIFEWKEKFMPLEGDNVFKYQRLLKRAFSLVGVVKNDVLSAIHAVRIDDTLFFFDLFVIPGWMEKEPSIGIRMVREMLSRKELKDPSIKTICALVRKGAEFSLEYYLKSGFMEMKESDPELEILQFKAGRVLSEVYPDWKPLGMISYHLRYSSEG